MNAKRGLRKFLMLLLPACLAFLGWGCGETQLFDEESSIIKVGDALPTFSVTDMQGEVYSNLSLKGSVSVIIFFYTPCGDCQRALPVLNEVYLSHRADNDIKWIAIGRDESYDAVARYWESHQLSLPCSPQANRRVYSLFATQRIPRVYISDADGVVRALYDDTTPITVGVIDDVLNSLRP